VSVSKVGGIFVHKAGEPYRGAKSTPAVAKEAPVPRPELTPAQEDQARVLADALRPELEASLRRLTETVAGTPPAEPLGDVQFTLREQALRFAAHACEQALRVKKTATTPPP
jgi:hypothetical protein